MEAFAQIVPEKNVRSCDMSIAEHLQKTLMLTILCNSSPEVLAMAHALGQSHREWFLGCAMLADMAVLPAKELYDMYAPHIVSAGIFRPESILEMRCRIQIMQVLSTWQWNQNLHGHCALFYVFDSMTGTPAAAALKLDGVDPRWAERLTDPKVHKYGGIFSMRTPNSLKRTDPAIDEVITSLVNPENPEVCRLAGGWFYAQMIKSGNMQHYFARLLLCGWKQWKGALTACAKKSGIHSFDMVISMLHRLPMTNMEKAEELKQLDCIAQNKSLRIQYGQWPSEWVRRQIAILEYDPNAEL